MFNNEELQTLENAAAIAALAAGKFINSYDRSRLEIGKKEGGDSLASQVVTEVDRQSEQIIKNSLARVTEKHDIAWLAEETALDIPINEHPRFNKQAFWCIDPLDGTLPFIEGTDGYAVSIALVSKSGEPILGVVYHPPTKTMYRTSEPTSIVSEDENQHLNFFTDRSLVKHEHFGKIKNDFTRLAQEMGFELLVVHSEFGAVMNAISVLTTPNSFYLKPSKSVSGGGSLWDFAAATALFKSADMPCGDIWGETMNFNQRDSLFMNKTGVLFAHDDTLLLKLKKLRLKTLRTDGL